MLQLHAQGRIFLTESKAKTQACQFTRARALQKKRLSQRVRQVMQDYAEVELWAMDEHRLGLKPIIKRGWFEKGKRPTTVVYHRYEWLYLYAFVYPKTGQNIWYIMPRVNIDIYRMVMKDFASSVGASENKGVIVVLDQAGWHSAKELPLGIELEYLPSYSPELQPVERVWELTDAPLVNRCFDSLDELETSLCQRCEYLMTQPDLVTSHTLFHWWPIF